MKVSKIVKYGAARSKVLFDEGLALVFYNGELRKYGISEGAELSGELYHGSIVPALVRRAEERLVYILKNSDKPEAELRRKLKEGCYPQEVIDEAISWAKSRHYIDDRRYADNYIRYHASGKSRKQLLFALQGKGIRKETAELLLEEAEIDESAEIAAELRKKGYDPESPEAQDRKKTEKIAASLIRKGFSFEAVRHAMRLTDG